MMIIGHWNKYQIKDLEGIKSKFPNGGKVLDLGAWDGATRSLFGEKWEWIGVDINPIDDSIIRGCAQSRLP